MLTMLEERIIDLLASELEKNHCPHSELIRKENIISKESTLSYSFLFLPNTVGYSVGIPGEVYLELELSRDKGYPIEVLLYKKDGTYTMIEIYCVDSSIIPEDVTIIGERSWFFAA